MSEWAFATIIVFLASVLQAVTGFGFAIVSTPFLLLIFNSRDCIQMSILLSLFIAIILTPKIRHHIDYNLLRRLILGSILGVPIGLLFYMYMSLDVLKKAVSITMLIITLFSLLKWYKNWRSTASPTQAENIVDRGSTLQHWSLSAFLMSLKSPAGRKETLVGLCAGILTTSIGMPGVPLALYFNSSAHTKDVIRSTTLAFFIVVYLASIIAQITTVTIGFDVISASLLLIPAAAGGVVLGHLLFPRINQMMFQLIANITLLYTACYMLLKAV